MKVLRRLEDIEIPLKNAVVTIGNFDGVHIGHQALLHMVVEKAAAIGGTSVVLTFDPHPMHVLTDNDHPPLITLSEQKTELIARAGIDIMILIPFTMEFAAITARAFVEDLLVRRIGMKALVTGNDYTFGHQHFIVQFRSPLTEHVDGAFAVAAERVIVSGHQSLHADAPNQQVLDKSPGGNGGEFHGKGD